MVIAYIVYNWESAQGNEKIMILPTNTKFANLLSPFQRPVDIARPAPVESELYLSTFTYFNKKYSYGQIAHMDWNRPHP